MAKKTIEIITSDLSGEELDRGKGRTVLFSVDDSAYSIDLTDAEAEEFHATLRKYTSVASRRSSRPAQSRKSNGSSGSGRTTEELAHIRAWAKEHGHQVSERGRIKGEVIEAFDQANN
ncbi:MAG: Lsr2 family protein [Aeromicrobium sp.]